MMNRAKALVLGVCVLGCLPAALAAQDARGDPREPSSHKRLGGGLDDMANPEAALAERLSMRHRMKGLDRRLDGDLAKMAGKLLRDEKFIESLRGQFSQEEIERLKGQFEQGRLTDTDALRDLLDRAKKSPAVDRATLDEIAKKLPEVPRPDAAPDREGPNGEAPQPPERPEPAPWRPEPPQANDWLKGSFEDIIKDLDKWADSPSGKSWAESLKELAKRADAGRDSTARFGERTTALSRWFGRVGGNRAFQPPRLGNPSLPRVPNVGVPSGGSLAGASGLLVVLLGASVLGMVLWRGREWFTALTRAGRSAWELGPWPVRPEDVTTRGDLVRAFEHLALLCLGPAARTCHHLELGERIGGQPALDRERRREAAADLSRLYERARYAPDQESLPGEDLRRARRELAFLAGA